MKKVVLVGGGITNSLLAIYLKRTLDKNIDILIIDKNEEIMKKVTVTGNGKCNILNKNYFDRVIFDDKRIADEFKLIDYDILSNFYYEIGLPLKEKDDLVYPFNESAGQTRDYLLDLLKEYDVKILTNEIVKKYVKENNKYIVFLEKYSISADFLVFSTGGKSYKVLGSDDSILEEFKKHSYKVRDFKPALCAIKVKENVKKLDGVRNKALVKILDNNKGVFEETGEVLFKKDGLSGIVIFNASLYISSYYKSLDNLKISINFIPELDAQVVANFKKFSGSAAILKVLTNKKLANYIVENENSNNFDPLKALENVIFKPHELYGFDSSQVSVGGVCGENLTQHLESKFEPNVYFGGELLNIVGYCGGYNLSMCLASAIIIGKSIIGKF